MIDGIRLKFCGLTSLVDANFADALGADYLGFILYPKSPRGLSMRDFENLKPNLPRGRKLVAVMVEPSDVELIAAKESGFDRFQIHFSTEFPIERIEGISKQVGRDRLWLVPKRHPESPMDERWLKWAETILVDTFSANEFGGSGKTGNWSEFARLQSDHPTTKWILAGGLNPKNIGDALTQSGARLVDVNSGVEIAPGIKDHAKMKAVVLGIHKQRTSSTNAHE